jgi:hypothetical protein
MLKVIKKIWQYVLHIPLNFLIWMDIEHSAPYRILHYLGVNVDFKYDWLPVGYGYETPPILIALKLNSIGALKALRVIRTSYCDYLYYCDHYITDIFDKAARTNDFKTAEILVDAGYIDIKSYPLYERYHHKPTKEEVKLLLDCGANPNLTDYQGYTALHCAVRSKNIEVVQILLNYKANPNLQWCNGKHLYGTALHEAIQYRNIQAIKLLCNAGADLKIYSYQGYAPIHEAAFLHYPEGVKMLLPYDPTQLFSPSKKWFGLQKVFRMNCPLI